MAQESNKNAMFYFEKDEIVWAKMRFFSAWPARVSDHFQREYRFIIVLASLMTNNYFVGPGIVRSVG